MSGSSVGRAPRGDVAALAVAGLLFAAALLHAVWALGVGWNHGIHDAYGFRQTQTALSVYYLLQGGPLLAYETPVFGYPWAIPFEFPIYQWLVAALVGTTGVAIEPAGRLVNAAFFLASLLPTWRIGRGLGLTPAGTLLCLAILLASPFYLFWSRTFMIESTALFFSLAYLAAVVSWRQRPSTAWLLAGTLFGSLAGLVKLTTFLAFLAAAGLLLAADVWRSRAWQRAAALRTYALAAVALALIPYAVSQVWVAYCDALKDQNPLTATYLTSRYLQLWVFGEWSQRVSVDTWTTIWGRHRDWVGHWIVLAIAAAALPFARGRRAAALAAAGLAFAVLLVFTNLHVIHDYYQYANLVLLLAAVGLVLAGLVEAGGSRRIAGLALAVLVIALMLRGHGLRYLELQRSDRRPHDEFAMHVREVVGPRQVIAIWGSDWSPELPYAARRRALMFIPYFDSRPTEPVLPQTLAALHANAYDVAGLVFCRHMREPDFTRPRLEYFPGFSRVYSGSNDCDLYAAALPTDRSHSARRAVESGPARSTTERKEDQ